MPFDGYPYLITRLAPAIYHLIVLPSEPDLACFDIAETQVASNRLETCLVMSSELAVYYNRDGEHSFSSEPPRGGAVVGGILAPPIAFSGTPDLRARQEGARKVFAATSRKGGYVLGDLTKGGRQAAIQDRQHLEGVNDDGSPRGLRWCEACGEWRGDCLDPNDRFRGLVMTVHCLCDNDNRCARCYTPLYRRRLNANYYDPDDGQIWHVPGFCAASSECGCAAVTSEPR